MGTDLFIYLFFKDAGNKADIEYFFPFQLWESGIQPKGLPKPEAVFAMSCLETLRDIYSFIKSNFKFTHTFGH